MQKAAEMWIIYNWTNETVDASSINDVKEKVKKQLEDYENDSSCNEAKTITDKK